ncbi:unnamed protein product [Clonostachys byssicola]|uniref:HIG1 domain-containing protein n=1 Tax=Clonostachys byssicola TaxID=160290 RepID=A0A9N9TZY5_9HYPO|nr:unnamed protein product [Clonostachys byssicola]
MKILTKEQEEAHYAAVTKGGLIGGSVGLGLGLCGVLLASKRFIAFRSLTLPFRTFLVQSAGTFGAVVNADQSSAEFHKDQNPMYSYKNQTQRSELAARENQSLLKHLVAYGREKRYSIVFASWLVSMGIAFALVNRSPMNAANKVVQARMYAQGLTLIVLVVTAALEMNDAKKGNGLWQTVTVVDPNDPGRVVEKKVHKEQYEGQDLWKDMVAAEERRLAMKKAADKEIREDAASHEPLVIVR